MSKIRIGLYLGAEPAIGGTFQYNQTMLEAISKLPQSKFETIVVFSGAQWETYVSSYSVSHKHIPRPLLSRLISFVSRKLCRSISTWRSVQNLLDPFARRMRGLKCDLWVFPSQDWLSYILDVPALGTIHDLMHRYENRFPEIGNSRESAARDRHYQATCTWCKGVLVDSGVGKEQVIDSYNVPDLNVYILPFTAPHYIYSNDPRPGFEAKYKLPRKFIFYPAQFWEHKNHKGLVLGADLAKTTIPDLQIVFVGSKKNGYESTRELVERLGLIDTIHFLGYVPDEDMPEFYRRARAMAMVSFCGPTNIPPLEAFVTGCPLAVSNVYAMPEQVGNAALLFDPNSPGDIAATLIKLWEDDELCLHLSQKGRERAKMYSSDAFTSILQNNIMSILDDVRN